MIPNSFRPTLLSHFREYSVSKSILLDYCNAHIDHVHALIILGKEQTIAEIMHLLKGESSNWINKTKLLNRPFAWQDDYFAASVSHSHLDRVRAYIKNQDEHHEKVNWADELNSFLEKYGFERMDG